MISLTEKASSELKKTIQEVNSSEKLYVRIAIKGGGCSGFKPTLCLDENKTEKDTSYIIDDMEFVIDQHSVMFLEGTTLDFQEGLMERGFKFNIAGAKGSCGCGQSISF